jgi:hypothetical protein
VQDEVVHKNMLLGAIICATGAVTGFGGLLGTGSNTPKDPSSIHIHSATIEEKDDETFRRQRHAYRRSVPAPRAASNVVYQRV